VVPGYGLADVAFLFDENSVSADSKSSEHAYGSKRYPACISSGTRKSQKVHGTKTGMLTPGVGQTESSIYLKKSIINSDHSKWSEGYKFLSI